MEIGKDSYYLNTQLLQRKCLIQLNKVIHRYCKFSRPTTKGYVKNCLYILGRMDWN